METFLAGGAPRGQFHDPQSAGEPVFMRFSVCIRQLFFMVVSS